MDKNDSGYVSFKCTDCIILFFFFFFQAEDGIRDLTVTGVQTCALPISRALRADPRELGPFANPALHEVGDRLPIRFDDDEMPMMFGRQEWRAVPFGDEIGRASCRERV